MDINTTNEEKNRSGRNEVPVESYSRYAPRPLEKHPSEGGVRGGISFTISGKTSARMVRTFTKNEWRSSS